MIAKVKALAACSPVEAFPHSKEDPGTAGHCAASPTLPGTVRQDRCAPVSVASEKAGVASVPFAERSEQGYLPENYDDVLSLIVTRATADEGAANLIALSVSTMTSSIRIKTGYG